MEWAYYAIIAGLFLLGELLAFPMAIIVLRMLFSIFMALDRFTEWCPGFSHLRRWRRRRFYRPGALVSRFVARDVLRDVEVVGASEIDAGRLTVRTRTWNVLYANHRTSPERPFGEVRVVALADLWAWSGEPWGGPVPEHEDDGPDAAADVDGS